MCLLKVLNGNKANEEDEPGLCEWIIVDSYMWAFDY